MIKGGTLKHWEERENMAIKMWVNKIDFPSPLEFSKLCLMVEAKIIAPSDIVLCIPRGNI